MAGKRRSSVYAEVGSGRFRRLLYCVYANGNFVYGPSPLAACILWWQLQPMANTRAIPAHAAQQAGEGESANRDGGANLVLHVPILYA